MGVPSAGDWIIRAEAMRRLGIHKQNDKQFNRVAEAAAIRMNVLPGVPARYSAEDIARIAADRIKVGRPRSYRKAVAVQ